MQQNIEKDTATGLVHLDIKDEKSQRNFIKVAWESKESRASLYSFSKWMMQWWQLKIVVLDF